jgi:four helix bundle protein
LRPIAEQVIRAAASIPANLAEGQGRSGQDRLYHWRVAYGSARELAVHLTLLADAGAVDAPAARRVLAQLDEVRAMLWRMTHPR